MCKESCIRPSPVGNVLLPAPLGLEVEQEQEQEQEVPSCSSADMLNWRWQNMTASHQSFAHGPDSGLGTVGDAHLAEDVLDMLFDRFVADRQGTRNFFIA